MDDDHLMVFLGGLHRSGTTMLASLLATHPDISAFHATGAPKDEGQHLQSVWPTDEHHGGPGRFARCPEAHMTSMGEDVATPLRAQWRRYWDLSRPVLLEKSPPNLLRFRALQEAFPNSAFVLIKRHPIPVSLSTRKWTPALTMEQLVEHWVHAYDLAAQDLPYLDRVMTLHYEDLIADPATALAQVADLVGLAAAFDIAGVDPRGNDRYFRGWSGDEALGRLASSVRRHGYDLTEEGPLCRVF
ncbi:sulfotransferase [Streptomyces sp. NPDC050315]|uniref:sulfotransferase family protein n=1 Tax=Streptomyces sp. NPDC050315 TaxID=3155039 RepID=UPI003442EBB8